MSNDPPVDPRGLRFAAWVSAAVLTAVLVTGSPLLLGAQALVFALGAFAGLRFAPYGVAYRVMLARRLRPPTEKEDSTPPRFAQGVGFAFAAVGTLGYSTGLAWLGIVATAFALGAALLNAAFGLCLGCELYLRLPRALRFQRTETSSMNVHNGSTDSQRGATA